MSLDTLRRTLSGLPPQVYFFAFGILLIGWIVVRKLRADGRRSKDVQAWCESAGFRFEKGPVPAGGLAPMRTLAPQSEPIPAGIGSGSRRVVSVDAQRVATGTRGGVSLCIFDEVKISRSDNAHGRTTWTHHYHTWVAVECPGCEFPRLSFLVASVKGSSSIEARMLGVVSGIGGFLATDGLESVGLRSHPGFVLRSADPERARALFEPLCGFFGEKRGWAVEAEGSWILIGCNPQLVGSGWYGRPLMDYVAVKKFDDLVIHALRIVERIRAAA